MSDDPGDLADYDAPPEDDSADADGSVERIDIGENEGPELTAGVLDDTESVAPRPGHDAGA